MNSTRISLALAALLASPVAFAASSAQATLGLSFQLIDLNPNDGITPWISFDQFSQSSVAAGAYQPLASQNGSAGAFGAFGNVATSANVPLAGSWASISGDALKTLTAGGFAAGLTPELMGYGQTSFSAEARGSNWGGSFMLSPFTLLVVAGQGHLTAATTIGLNQQFWTYEIASASIHMTVDGVGSDGSGMQNSFDSASANASYQYGPDGQGNWGYQPQAFDIQESVTVSFLNLTAGDLQGSVHAMVSASGQSAVTAVPEPGSVALMLSGLGLIGWFGRRQSRR
jgi:predicted DNA-binding WGR domain protein